jgi:mannan endo-1,4-beta-mannosidase
VSTITANGTNLMLYGQPYRPLGLNAYEMATYWGVNAGCGGMLINGGAVPGVTLDTFFGSLPPGSLTRFWCTQSMATNFTSGLTDWTALDIVFSKAAQYGQYLLCTLSLYNGVSCDTATAAQYNATPTTDVRYYSTWTSGYAYSAGMWVQDTQAGSNNDWFYSLHAVTSTTPPHSDPTNWSNYRQGQAWFGGGYASKIPGQYAPLSFQAWVAACVGRYKNSPAVGLWELISEPEVDDAGGESGAYTALRYFFDNMGAYLKTIDSTHLISSGVIGSGQYGASGGDYQSLHASPGIDVCSYHDYGYPPGTTYMGLPGDQYNGLYLRTQQAAAVNKPLLIGEAGIQVPEEVSSFSARAADFYAKYQLYISHGISGILAWDFVPAYADNYDIGPGDPYFNYLIGQEYQMAVLEIQLRRDTAANWTSNNPVLKQGEEGLETDALTSGIVQSKIGDGVTAWNALPYVVGRTPGVFVVPAPTGIAATDQAAIASAITAASAYGGGTVRLQAGTYGASSIATVSQGGHTVASTSTTWTYTGTAPTVGQYIIGTNISGRAPKILTVNPGTGFTTDIAPGGTVSGSVTFVTPGVVLPDGVTLQGVGATTGTGGTTATTIYDNGTGVTVFLRGGNNLAYYAARSKIHDLSVWGSPTGATIGSTLAGVYCANNSSFFEVWGCDIAGHGTWGLGLDNNINSFDCRNTSFRYNGPVSGASTPTGGAAIQPFGGSPQLPMAAINFYNCWWEQNNGFGLTAGNGGAAVSLYDCQFNNTATNGAYLSGSSIQASAVNTTLINVYSESATLDLAANYASVTIIGGVFNSGSSYAIFSNESYINIQGLSSNNHSTASIDFVTNPGAITWSGCSIDDPTFISGEVSAAQAAGIGTYSTSGATATYAPGLVTPSTPVTVASNAGTVPVTSAVNKFTNSSAATMAITMATSGAVDGQETAVLVYDFSAAAETIGWTNTENSTVSAPTTSNGSTTLPKTVTFQFNGATSKWRCIASV